jgi:hypothetical protein
MLQAMENKRTVKSVAQKIADFSRSNHRMPTYEEMLALLAVQSKSVVNFWVNKLLDENILEKDQKGRLCQLHGQETGHQAWRPPARSQENLSRINHSALRLRDLQPVFPADV